VVPGLLEPSTLPDKSRLEGLVPWAWSAAWLLTGLGFSILASSSLPSPHLFAYIALGLLGWGAAGFVTARAAGGAPGKAVRLAGWGIAALVAILLGLVWMIGWDAGFLGGPAAVGLAGVIGGLAGSVRKGAWRLASGILLGLVFLLLATLSFYNSYFLMYYYTPISRVFGSGGVNVFVFGWPAAFWGLVAGFAARRILGMKVAASRLVS
jgi:hypothetical protein